MSAVSAKRGVVPAAKEVGKPGVEPPAKKENVSKEHGKIHEIHLNIQGFCLYNYLFDMILHDMDGCCKNKIGTIRNGHLNMNEKRNVTAKGGNC